MAAPRFDSSALELDSVSAFRDTRWLGDSDDEAGVLRSTATAALSATQADDGRVASGSEEKPTPAQGRAKSSARSSSKKSQPHAAKKGKQTAAPAAATPTPGSGIDGWTEARDELVLDPEDALKIKVVVEATAPALLHFRKGSRQVPFHEMIPRDPAFLSPKSILPELVEGDDASMNAHFSLLKSSWPAPERIERLKSAAIVQLPRDLDAEADQADGIEQDTFVTLADALEAALATGQDGAQRDTGADESREEEDFVRLRNVVYLVASIRRQFFRLLRNPSGPSGFLQADQLGRHLPHLRHKEFRILSQPAAAKTEEEAPPSVLQNGAQGAGHSASSPGSAPVPSAPTPMALTRADTALTTLWTQVWYNEVLQGATLVLALLNELAQRKAQQQYALARANRDEHGSGDEGEESAAHPPNKKRARHHLLPSTSRLLLRRKGQSVPLKLAMHMRLGVFGDMFTNAADMPRKFWERHYAAASGQFAAEPEDLGQASTDEEDVGLDTDEEYGAGHKRRRTAAARKHSHGAAGGTANGTTSLDSAISAARKGRAKGSGKGMGKGWRKGRTKALEQSEEVNREEERRRDQWAAGDIDFGAASIVAISSLRRVQRDNSIPSRIPTLGERLLADRPATDLQSLTTAKPAAGQPIGNLLEPANSLPLHRRFPGRLADFLYYNQYASFAPSFDTSKSSRSGEGSAQLWWAGRQEQNRLKRFHSESAVPAYVLSPELEEAFGGVPQPPPTLAEAQLQPFIQPRTVLSDAAVKDALNDVQNLDFQLDPALLQAAYARLADESQTPEEDGMRLDDARQDDGAGDQDVEELTEQVLQHNQYLVQALVVLQGQRMLSQVRAAAEAASKVSRHQTPAASVAWEALPVERLIARELLSSLGSLLSLRPRTTSGTASLLPSTETLRAAAASAHLPSDEPAFWGTIPPTHYTQTLPPLLIDQIHREAGRKGPLVLKDNTAALLADKPPAQPQVALDVTPVHPGTLGGVALSGFPPAPSAAGVDAYGRPPYGVAPAAASTAVAAQQGVRPAVPQGNAAVFVNPQYAQAVPLHQQHPTAGYGSPARSYSAAGTPQVSAHPQHVHAQHQLQQHHAGYAQHQALPGHVVQGHVPQSQHHHR